MHIYSRHEQVKSQINACVRFLKGIDIGEHPETLRVEAERDLRYWQTELSKL